RLLQPDPVLLMPDDKLAPAVASPPRGLPDRFVGFILGKPAIALVMGLAIVLGLASGGSKIKANFTHTAFFEDDDRLLQEFNKFERQYGNDDSVIIVVHSPSGVFDKQSARLLQDLTKRMWLVPDIIRVDSLANYSWVHATQDDIKVEPLIPDEPVIDDSLSDEEIEKLELELEGLSEDELRDRALTDEILAERKKVALEHETLPDYLVSRDGKTALVYARLRPGFEKPPDTETVVLETRKLVAEIKSGDHSFYLTGGPTINFAFKESSQKDSETLVPIVLLMAFLALILLLRAIGGVLLPMVIIVVSIAAAMGFAGHMGLEISSVTIVLPQILIAVAIADSVHILSSFYRARRRGMPKRESIEHTLSKNLVPTILTSISTAAGFFAFSTSNLKPIFGLGMMAGVGTIVAWFATYLIMGPLLVWAPSWVKAKGNVDELKQASPWIIRYTGFIHKYRWAVIAVYSAMTIGAVFMSAANTVNSDPYKYFAKEYPLRKAQDFILDNLSGIASFEMSISAGKEEGIKDPAFLKKVEKFSNQVIAMDGVSKSVSLVDIFKQTNRSLNGDQQEFYKLPDSKDLVAQEFLLYTMSLPQGMDVNDRVTVKNDAIRLTLISELTESSKWTAAAAEMKKKADALGLDVTVSGKTMLYQSMNGYVTRSFVQSIIIAIFLVSLILIVAFKSIRLGALAMIPNLIPLVFGGAVLYLIGQSLDIGTVLVCSVCLGIAVDDTIHILTNYQRQRRAGKSPSDSIAFVLSHTGPALVVTTFVLVAAFGTLAFATFIPNVYFGIMTAVILVTALVTDFTFLPAILMARDSRKASADDDAAAATAAAAGDEQDE
ncbi:MAG: MMPL family transporter, partial [Deltaproteobacteria bacterium]|nr:MMPL family transporter [Deltaproteobacteria bacterium]